MVTSMQKNRVIGYSIALIFLLSLVSMPYALSSQNCNTQILAQNATVSSPISAIIDSLNSIHIAYFAYENGSYSSPIQVMYGVYSQSIWSVNMVGYGRGTIDLAINSRREPCLVFNDYRNSSLEYANWADGQWHIASIASNGVSASLAVDSNNVPHVAFFDDEGLKYGFLNDEKWYIQLVDSTPSTANGLSLVLDSNNYPHIFYSCENLESNSDIAKYASLNNSGWTFKEPISNVSGFGNLVLDSNNYPHFIYTKNYPSSTIINSTLIYRSWNSSAWYDQIVISAVHRLNGAGQLRLDSHDNPYFVFLNESEALSDKSLIFASFTNDVWSFQTIDSNKTTTNAGTVIIDSKGNPNFLYLRSSQNRWINYLIYGNFNSAQLSEDELSLFQQTWMPLVIIFVILVLAILMFKFRRRKRGGVD
jgi:hypothetical protein